MPTSIPELVSKILQTGKSMENLLYWQSMKNLYGLLKDYGLTVNGYMEINQRFIPYLLILHLVYLIL